MPDPASPTAPREAWQHILLSQANQRPAWQLQDVYKLAFQAALGSEHAAPDETAARRWLEQEIATLGSGPDDPAIEPISPDNRLVRINLRPYLAAGGSLEPLLQAFLRTAVGWQGQRTVLHQSLATVVDLSEAGELAFSPSDARTYFNRLANADYPAAHHSPLYRDLYHPAYRVILLDLLPSLP